MGWILLVLLIFGPVVVLIVGSMMEDRRKTEWGQPETRSYTPPKKLEPEIQYLQQSYQRFSGAVQAIRQQPFVPKYESQYAWMHVKKHVNGNYSMSCRYDHDSNVGVMDGLSNGGYFEYIGISVIDDGFTYELPEVFGDDYAYTLNNLIYCFQERNKDAVVIRANEYTEADGKMGLHVTFKFH